MSLIIRSSSIHAAGCYATARIPKGTRAIEYTGPRITKALGDQLYEDRDYTYLFGIGDGTTVIDGHGTAAFINHSCDPNCEAVEDDDGRVWIVTLRDIAPGEELTYDYNLYDGDGEAPCRCGARKCRGSMYSQDELRKRRRVQRRKKKAAAEKPRHESGKSRGAAPLSPATTRIWP